MSLSSDFQKLSVAGLVTLYELDATNIYQDKKLKEFEHRLIALELKLPKEVK